MPECAEDDVRNYWPAYPAVRNLTVFFSTTLLNCSTSRVFWSVQMHIPVQVFNNSSLFSCSTKYLWSTVQQHISIDLFNSTCLSSVRNHATFQLFNSTSLFSCSSHLLICSASYLCYLCWSFNKISLFNCSTSLLCSTFQQHISVQQFNSTCVDLFNVTSLKLFYSTYLFNCSASHLCSTVQHQVSVELFLVYTKHLHS